MEDDGVDAHSTRSPVPENTMVQSRQGYCACCQVLYTNLEQHLQTNRHKQFSSESRRPVMAKSLLERFLQDVIQYHPSRYNDTRSTYVDLPLVCAPLVPKNDLADVHLYQEDQEIVGTREELPSTDVSIPLTPTQVRNTPASCTQVKECTITSPDIRETVAEQTTFLNPTYASGNFGPCKSVARKENPTTFTVCKRPPLRGQKEGEIPIVLSLPSHCKPNCTPRSSTSAQASFPQVTSDHSFRVSKYHKVNTQGRIVASLSQLRESLATSSRLCTLGLGQANGSGLHSRSTGCPVESDKLRTLERGEDMILETIERVIRNYCDQPQPQVGEGDRSVGAMKERATSSQLEGQRQTAARGLESSPPDSNKLPEVDCIYKLSDKLRTFEGSPVKVSKRPSIKKKLSPSFLQENNPAGPHEDTGQDVESFGSIGSQLGRLKSSSSSDWDAPLKLEKVRSKIAAKDLEALTDTRVTLEDDSYKTRLSSVLHFPPAVNGHTEEANVADSETLAKREASEETGKLPYIPKSFAGKTWSEIMAEDDLKVDALVKEFREGRYLCYFDSESLTNHGKKQRKKRRSDTKDASKTTSKLTAASSQDVPMLAGLPPLPDASEDTDDGCCLPAVGPQHRPATPGQSPELRSFRLASRCQVVKVSHGTQTSELRYPALKRKSRRDEAAAAAEEGTAVAQSAPREGEEMSEVKTRLCSLRLPDSYSKILSPVQPRTIIYVLSSPDLSPGAGELSADPHPHPPPPGVGSGRKTPKALEDTRYTYKKSPVKYYDPTTNRIVKSPPRGLLLAKICRSPHHVRKLFRSLSPDINVERPPGGSRPGSRERGGGGGGGQSTCSTVPTSTSSVAAVWPDIVRMKERVRREAAAAAETGSGGEAPAGLSPSGEAEVEAKPRSLVLSPIRKRVSGAPSGSDPVLGPRSRAATEKENPRAPRARRRQGAGGLHNPRGASSRGGGGGSSSGASSSPPGMVVCGGGGGDQASPTPGSSPAEEEEEEERSSRGKVLRAAVISADRASETEGEGGGGGPAARAASGRKENAAQQQHQRRRRGKRNSARKRNSSFKRNQKQK
ncbi:DBF4-type zinc finger-containing protein 2 [Callorhinchus milii]|uniref:DBF4-type zinc finger-containing protein 2 n=1 Tax=Callorhinchus milii TaxID=7868 RepID=UPI001C3F6562|nr:DBF4-type zinc finger-containing protein 2 [Callorhinchus milii]